MSDCIEWTGARHRDGYGHRRVNGKYVRQHRHAWIEANGPIPDGMCVLHRCDNPPCFNVDHLFLGTRLDNNRDMVAKGRLGTLRGADSPSSRLTQTQVDEIRSLYAAGGIKQADIASRFGISNQHVSRIVLGQTWTSTFSS